MPNFDTIGRRSGLLPGSRSFKWLVGIGTLSGALGVALAYVASNDWFGSGDLRAMVFWSLPPAVLVAALAAPVARRLNRSGAFLHYLVLVPLGAAVGFLWTVCAAMLLGGWIATFSFPVLFCWVGGGVLGGIAAAWLARPRSWPAGLLVMVVLGFGAARLYADARAPDAQIRIVIKAGATPDEVQRVWSEVLGRRTGHGAEYEIGSSLSSVSAIGNEGNSPILIATFAKGTSNAERERIVAQIRQSPLVQRVDSLPMQP
ncbi:MAG: hypothetical protein ABJE47_16415 [bacterium]